MTPPPADLRQIAARLAKNFPGLTLSQRLRALRAEISGRLVFTTSLGLEDQALTHAIFIERLNIELVTLDTQRLFPETREVWAATEWRYGQRIRGFTPQPQDADALVARQGIDGFRASIEARKECCFVRKVEPLGRALAGASGWITGLRADQSADRSAETFASFDEARDIVKLNPLLDWTRARVADFVRDNGVPYNALHDHGFLSIGCAPCTRAVAPGEPERAGRWWWEQEEKRECGLHSRAAQSESDAASPSPAPAGS